MPTFSSPYLQMLAERGDPSTRYKLARLLAPGEHLALREEVRRSSRVTTLLSERGADGRIAQHPYAKWTGAHWVLATLADLGYPQGDETLHPLREQVLEWLLDERRLWPRRASAPTYLAPIRIVSGRARIHASLEGNALYSLLALGLADSRVDQLAARLVDLQWEDGGWNCDRTPSACHSSFEETLLPLRGLIWHAREHGSRASAQAARRAAKLLLERGLFRRKSSGEVIAPDFVQLHYPCYWHYDVLFGLKVLAEGELLTAKGCSEALALLRSKQLEDGGFPAEARYWRSGGSGSGRSLVGWGPTGQSRSNEFVTADALFVLVQARRLRLDP